MFTSASLFDNKQTITDWLTTVAAVGAGRAAGVTVAPSNKQLAAACSGLGHSMTFILILIEHNQANDGWRLCNNAIGLQGAQHCLCLSTGHWKHSTFLADFVSRHDPSRRACSGQANRAEAAQHSSFVPARKILFKPSSFKGKIYCVLKIGRRNLCC